MAGNAPDRVSDDAGPRDVRGITTLSAIRYGADRLHDPFQVDLANAKGESGAVIEDIAKLPRNYWNGDGTIEGDFTFWKLSLKGKDGGIDYGPLQGNIGNTQSRTGTDIARIRVAADGQIEFMPEETGEWTGVHGDGSGLQFVFYYLQDTLVDSKNPILHFRVSEWFLQYFCPPTSSSPTPCAVITEVIDADSGKQIAKSDTMYYVGNNLGVQNITVDAIDENQYHITRIEAYKAAYQGDTDPWSSTEKADPGHPFATYDYTRAHDGSMSLSWDGGDPHHSIFTVYVSRTAQVGLVKRLSGADADRYRSEPFTFSAHLELPAGAVLHPSYPARGLADGATELRVTPDAADPSRGEMTGIAALPDRAVSIRGLPEGTRVRFSETGAPDRDPSAFSTSWTNDVTGGDNGSATARRPDATGEGRPQTVTATNEVSAATGKLTITKTLTGLSRLTSRDRIDLAGSFSIESGSGALPALTFSNATETTPAGGILDEDVDEVTCTWRLSRAATGRTILTERGYAVASTTVAAQVRVGTGALSLSDSAEVDIGGVETRVAFVNEYGAPVEDLRVSKSWPDTAEAERAAVVVELSWSGTEPGASGVLGTRQLDAAGGWSVELAGMPTATAATGEISYTAREVSVGGLVPERAGYEVAVTRRGAAITVINTRIPTVTLRIEKSDAEGGAPLAGAGFSLEPEGGGTARTAETDDSGVALIAGIRHGTYLLSETRAPSGYQLATRPWRIVADTSGVTVFVADEQGRYPDEGSPAPVCPDGSFRVAVADTRTPELPSAGASSPLTVAEGGGAAIALACGLRALTAGLARRRR
ncbi:Cna B domain protein [Coriobacterium glomerans PW2]|uniref:Cna B domain protein n=1 Tax=Coriobacterium glomerans (strain ATCC 49209 / DSM 20642 / JCM 10262 / PW2) TaxID=700015 RepID=F2N9N8_CORGP|nr:SpaA isopeptide-forming pilin-related protein [Coriobacterium glomerans]AEB07141.1 Cna B domain protein [Coriobacterium glomerans PW2]